MEQVEVYVLSADTEKMIEGVRRAHQDTFPSLRQLGKYTTVHTPHGGYCRIEIHGNIHWAQGQRSMQNIFVLNTHVRGLTV